MLPTIPPLAAATRATQRCRPSQTCPAPPSTLRSTPAPTPTAACQKNQFKRRHEANQKLANVVKYMQQILSFLESQSMLESSVKPIFSSLNYFQLASQMKQNKSGGPVSINSRSLERKVES